MRLWKLHSRGDTDGRGYKMKRAVLCLGTNIGDRTKNLHDAVGALSFLFGTDVIKTSKVYETEPFEVPDEQENFYNCCVMLETELSPKMLMGACLGIEAKMGRLRPYKNSPRIIDIDIILYEGEKINDVNLTIPHPRFLERAFVLLPLLDIFPDGNAFGIGFGSSLDNLDTSGVKRVS